MPDSSFRGHIPADRWYCRTHDMWVTRPDDASGEVLIGATGFGLFLAGELIAFTAKPRGARIERGRGLGTVECRKTVLAVHAPISFTLAAGNEAAEERPDLILATPYTTGWMARGTPLCWAEEATALCDAHSYREHILRMDPGARFDE